ncbi:MAG: response regulator [Verrucomicrobia bacterium]|nr:response regulator [Verrucomicrobiota bacterium]
MYRGKVLVVDDDQAVNAMLTEVLANHGYHTVTALAAEQALDKYRHGVFDVVVSDVKMPGMDGTELLRHLHEIDGDTAVILVTGYADLSSARDAVRGGAFDYVLKPFDLGALVREVDEAAAETRRHREAREEHRQLETLVEEKTQDLAFQSAVLHLEQERFHGILKSANFGLLVLNGDDDTVILANEHAKRYLRLRSLIDGDYFGEHYSELCPDDMRERVAALVDAVKRRLQVCSQPPFTNREGFVLELQSYPVMTQGTLRATVIVANDITERTKLEEQLLVSSKLAGIGELAAGIAHEINNPIGFVASNTRTLQRYVHDLSELVSEYHKLKDIIAAGQASAELVEKIEALERRLDVDFVLEDIQDLVEENGDGLNRVVKILRDLKNFSHADEEEPQPVDLNAVIEDALNLARNELKYKAEVETDFGELPPLSGHPGQLSQVFINILVNAAHAIEDRGTIAITTKADGDAVVVRVRDTGCGMTPEVRACIFDPFFTTKGRGKGTGLGLSIALEIVQKHGGTIAVESAPGEGSTFVLTFPVRGESARGPE